METKLKKLLREKEITQTELYRTIKDQCNSYLGQDVISRIVNGKKKNFELYTLLKICLALNCKPSEIIDTQDFIEKCVSKNYLNSLQ
jgi:DNA-binding Xre family transcriptional regulator